MKLKVKEINLLPKEYIQAQKIKIYILMGFFAVFLECIVFVLMVVLPPMQQIKEQQNILQDLELKVNKSEFLEVNATIEKLNQSKEEVGKWVGKYKAIKKPNFVSGKLLEELVARLPKGVTIDNIEAQAAGQAEGEVQAEGPSIIIKGRTQTGEEVLNYITIMETIYKGAAVTFNIEDGTAESNYQKYDITIKIPSPQIEKPEEVVTEVPAETPVQTSEEVSKEGTES